MAERLLTDSHDFRSHIEGYSETENQLYRQMRDFWVAILSLIHETGKWPDAYEIFAT
jgi:hypothetical protein